MSASALAVHVLALAGTVLSVVRVAPMLVRLVRTRDPGGVSAGSLAVLSVSGLWWVAYSVDLGNVPSLVASTVGLAVSLLALAALVRLGHVGAAPILFVLGGVVVAALVVRDVEWIAALSAASAGVIALPQAWEVGRNPEATSGVSLGAWALIALNAAVWLAYGLLIGHPVLGIAGVVTLPTALMVWVRVLSERRRPRVEPA